MRSLRSQGVKSVEHVTKTLTFQSTTALEEWKLRTAGKVIILAVITPDITFGYNLSRAFLEPYIRVEYFDLDD